MAPSRATGAAEPAKTIDTAVVRARLPVTATVTYLNTATCAPMPTVVAHAMAHDAGIELHTGRVGLAGYARAARRRARLRGQLAALVGAAPDEIAITSSTTSGLNTVVSGYDWRPGDRAVATTLEHTGALAPLYQARRRHGIEVVLADVGDGEPDRALSAVAAAIAYPATRLLVVSQVTYGTGARLPLDEIVRVAHDAGVDVLADGAQSVGAVPVDVTATGVDYFAFPGRKWLFGPEGVGALYVDAAKHHHLYPLELGVTSFDATSVDGRAYRDDDAGSMRLAAGAARFDQQGGYRPLVAGWSASLDWLGSLGWPAVHATVATHTDYARARAAAIPGARVLTPVGADAGIVAFTLEGVDAGACAVFLAQRSVAVRPIPDNGAIRMSFGVFAITDEIDRAFALVEEFRRQY